MRTRILFVDSTLASLKYFFNLLQPMRSLWDVSFVSSGAEALQLLEANPFDILISDLHLPDMEGHRFFTQVLQKYPQVIRFALVEDDDVQVLIKVSHLAHQYLQRSANLEMFKNAVERATALQKLLSGEKLRKIVSQLGELPGLPDVFLSISSELRSADPSVKKVGELIEREPGLGVKVLKLVNSASYGLRQKVTSPTHAASLLGLESIQSIVLATDIFEDFDRIRLSVPSFSLEEFQHHSLTVGKFTMTIASMQGLSRMEVGSAMMAGLLHDIGKLILARSFPKEYRQVLEEAREKNVSQWMVEQEVFGATHGEIGAYLLGLWGLHSAVVEACAFHHHPHLSSQAGFSLLTAVHIADGLDAVGVDGNFSSWTKINIDYLREMGVEDRLSDWREACPPTAWRTMKLTLGQTHARPTVRASGEDPASGTGESRRHGDTAIGSIGASAKGTLLAAPLAHDHRPLGDCFMPLMPCGRPGKPGRPHGISGMKQSPGLSRR